jgi:poly(rC)-binding protein 2/3/4
MDAFQLTLNFTSAPFISFFIHHFDLFFFQNTTVSQDRNGDGWSDMSHPSIGSAQVNQPPSVVDEYILPVKRDSLYLEREPLVDHNIHRSGVSLYGRDPALSTLRPSGIHGAGPLLTQV